MSSDQSNRHRLAVVCVFCGSSPGTDPAYAAAARRFGDLLGRTGRDLVYGGGRIGMMGELADAAMAAGSRVIGVIPRAMVAREMAHPGASEMRIVSTMHERKAMMSDLSDAFVALPGGIASDNEASLVLAVESAGRRLLLTGDIEGPALEQFKNGCWQPVAPARAGPPLTLPRPAARAKLPSPVEGVRRGGGHDTVSVARIDRNSSSGSAPRQSGLPARRYQ